MGVDVNDNLMYDCVNLAALLCHNNTFISLDLGTQVVMNNIIDNINLTSCEQA